MPLNWRDTWARAHEAMQSRAYRRADRRPILDLDPLDVSDEILTDPAEAKRKNRRKPNGNVTHARSAPGVTLDGHPLNDRQAAAALRLVGFERATDGSVIPCC